MKKWEKADINCVAINETEHQVRFSFQLDGGYIGDGKVSGWFGPDPKPQPQNPTEPTTPTTPGEEEIATDTLS
jgi:hypothetical protein